MNVGSMLVGVGSSIAKSLVDKGMKYGMSLLKGGKKGLGDNLSKLKMISCMETALEHVKMAEKMIEDEI